MLRFEFILPFTYGAYMSVMIIKGGLFDLSMNTLLWSVYLMNMFMAYALFKIGKVIDRCLGLY